MLQGDRAGRHKREVGLRLRAAREAAGFPTARQFAARLRISESRLTKYERGDRYPPLLCLAAIRSITQLSIDFLVTGDFDPRNGPAEILAALLDMRLPEGLIRILIG
jgi:transcriptional regulator with XRE-family HTH domain